MELLRASDPDGGFVAVDGGRVLGVGQAMVRERVWCLSLLTVDPEAQTRGAGGALLRATLEYRRAERRGAIIVSSDDPRALTLYARSGFVLQPTFEAFGAVGELPPADGRVRRAEGTSAELRELAGISRALRGAAHTPELEFALQVREARLLVFEDQRGFAVAMDGQGVWLLAAMDEAAARVLLVESLRAARERAESPVGWITAAQQWAVQTLVAVGLRVRTSGALCVHGTLGPLCPYLPSPAFA